MNPFVNAGLPPEELPIPYKPLLSISDASTYCGLSIRSINNLIYKRYLHIIHIGRRVYIRRSDLDQLIEKGTRP